MFLIHVMFMLVHLFALIFAAPLLIVTILIHLIVAKALG